MQNDNMLKTLLDNLTAFAVSGTGSSEQINAFGYEIRGLEQGARVATVKLAIGCLRRYANGDKQKFFAAGEDQRLKNYYSVFNGLVAEGYAPATQLAWFGKVEGNFSAVYGQSKKAAIAALQEAGILEKPATPAAPAAPAVIVAADVAAESGEITASLSDADRAGNIAAELIGQMSPEVFDLLSAAVAQRMASDSAAQQRRDAAAAERQAAADIAAAVKAAQEKAAADAARIGELRRAADAADLAAIAADQEAKQPDATAATKKRAAKLLKAAQAAGAAYQAAIAA